MRLIDADAFDRRLANAEFAAALNNADDNDRPFEHEAMYYSTQSFRDVMSHQPTVDAIPVEWVKKKITGATKDLGAVIHDGVLKELLFDWQKEQEAR